MCNIFLTLICSTSTKFQLRSVVSYCSKCQVLNNSFLFTVHGNTAEWPVSQHGSECWIRYTKQMSHESGVVSENIQTSVREKVLIF
jgi:hypothetical protein